MNKYRVNAVDVNDVWIQTEILASNVDKALNSFDNDPDFKYLTVVNVEAMNPENEWVVVWSNELDPDFYDEFGDGMSDVEADADTLRSAGWGTDEDYDYFSYGDEY